MFRKLSNIKELEYLKELLSDNKEAISNISAIMDQSLCLAKLESSGKLEIDHSSCDIREIITESIKIYKNSESNIDFNVDINNLPKKFKCDQNLIRITLNNIISNAVKYSLENPKVLIKGKSKNGKIILSVQDNGIGINKREMHKIGNRFFRSSNALKYKVKGNGLGVFLAKKIIEAHQGRLIIRSEQGTGTVIFILLPLSPNM